MSELYTLREGEFSIVAYGEKAILIEVFGEQMWIPRSQIHGRETIKEGDDLSIPVWLAKLKGLI
jgi:hypothetical protein